MSAEKKVISGQEFCKAVDAAETPEDLFKLTYEVLNSSYSHRNLEQRIGNTEIPATNAARHIRAQVARTKAMLGHNLSTAEKLTVLIDSFYEKGFDKELTKSKNKNVTNRNDEENDQFAHLLHEHTKTPVQYQ